jgi:hypothetical protein
LNGEQRGAPCLGLGDRNHRLRVLAGDLQLRIKVGGAELQRLELADQLAELFALLEIVDGHVHRRRADSDQLRRCPRPTGAERPVQHRLAAADLADHRIGIDLDAVEGHAGADAGIGDHPEVNALGFLCVDTMSTNRFNDRHHVQLMAAFGEQSQVMRRHGSKAPESPDTEGVQQLL